MAAKKSVKETTPPPVGEAPKLPEEPAKPSERKFWDPFGELNG